MSNLSELRRLIDLIKHLGGLTQAAIAEKAGYERTYLSQALKMENPPEKLINKLNLTFSDILEQKTPSKKDGLGSSKKGFKIEAEDYLTTKDDLITFLKKDNARLEKEIISLKNIEEDLIAVSGMNTAILEILMILASEKKTVYNKCIEVLKKYELEGSLL